jgi:hypothetical protein
MNKKILIQLLTDLENQPHQFVNSPLSLENAFNLVFKKENLVEAINSLEAVLCDPEGEVCINGSDSDRKIIQDSLKTIKNL